MRFKQRCFQNTKSLPELPRLRDMRMQSIDLLKSFKKKRYKFKFKNLIPHKPYKQSQFSFKCKKKMLLEDMLLKLITHLGKILQLVKLEEWRCTSLGKLVVEHLYRPTPNLSINKQSLTLKRIGMNLQEIILYCPKDKGHPPQFSQMWFIHLSKWTS